MGKNPLDSQLSAHNLRIRAQQMKVVADSVQSGSVRERLMKKVAHLLQQADEAELKAMTASGNA